MAAGKEMTVEEILRRQTWHYVGIGLLWLALIVVGVALERSGMAAGVLAGVLPGEAGALREQVAGEERHLATLLAEQAELEARVQTFMKAQEDLSACEVRLAALKKAAAR